MRKKRVKSKAPWSKRVQQRLREWSRHIPYFRGHLPAFAKDAMNSPFSLALIVFLGAGLASVVRLADKSRTSEADLYDKPASVVAPLLAKSFADLKNPIKLPSEPWQYFKPIWSVGRTLLPAEPEFPEFELAEKAKSIVSDPKEKVESDFRVPSFMKSRVEFWVVVHTVFSSKMRVVHDRFDPSLVYGFIDLRPLYRINGPGPDTETKAYRIEKAILAELKNQMRQTVAARKGAATSPAIDNLKDFLASKNLLDAAQVEKKITSLRTQTGQSDEFISALHRSKQLLPHIESVFRKQGLPVALGRIPFVESSFNPRASSKVGAVGAWQFMPETARQMISATDKAAWADPLKQTAAATKLFKIYRNLLPDWGTVVTSYNSGVGRLQRLVKKHKAKNLAPILESDDDEGLGFAGKNFYAQFLSANLVEAYKDELFGGLIESVDINLVIKGQDPFAKEKCDM